MSKPMMKRYKAYLEKLRERKVALACYECPDCGYLIHAQVPPPLGTMPGTHVQTWTSCVECPDCNHTHFKAITSEGEITINGEVQS